LLLSQSTFNINQLLKLSGNLVSFRLLQLFQINCNAKLVQIDAGTLCLNANQILHALCRLCELIGQQRGTHHRKQVEEFRFRTLQ